MKKEKIKVLMVSSEVTPIVKVGGLGDVLGSLPAALSDLGCQTTIIIPLSRGVDKVKYRLKKVYSGLPVEFSGRKLKVNIWRAGIGVRRATVYFLENNRYFGNEAVYPPTSLPGDDHLAEKFFFFDSAVLSALPILKIKPDIIHCHDFFSAFIPILLKVNDYPYLRGVKTLFTIHNFENQGRVSPKILALGGLRPESLPSLQRDTSDGDINLMVEGLFNADLVNAVSPNYAQEIMTSHYAAGLRKITNKLKTKIFGVLNGIDISLFDPARDRAIYKKYSFHTPERKMADKLFLQKKLGWPQNEHKALVGMICRLSDQKGWELITEKLIEKSDCQFVFLGEGEKRYADFLRRLEKKYPEKARAFIGFDAELASCIYAGADIFMIPSRFEPCGLTQMISARYGTVIVARSTGGLKDTVTPDIGFTFEDFSAENLEKTLSTALSVYYNFPKKWLKLKINCLKKDFSWRKTAKGYLQLYKKLVG
jgi:starch synthase